MDDFFSTWWQAFDDFNVDVIFNGHTHNYQRTVPINRNISVDSAVDSYGDCSNQGRCQIVTGGAGAPLKDIGEGWFIKKSYSILHFVTTQVFEDRLIIKAYDQNHNIIDSLSIIKETNIHSVDNYSICTGDSILWQGAYYSTIGQYFKNYQTTSGCDSLYELNLNVRPTFYYTDTLEICTGDSISWQGANYNIAGQYFKNYQTVSGCDSIYELNLNVQPTFFYIDTHEICTGDSILWQGAYYKTTGQYFANHHSTSNCDSIYELSLTVHPTYYHTDVLEICTGDSISWQGEYYKTTGQYFAHYQTTIGCDSIYELNLIVHPTYYYIEKHEICDGDNILWQGSYYNTTGRYFKNYQTLSGCDSIYELELIANPVPSLFEISGQNLVSENQEEIYIVPANSNVIYTWDVQNGTVTNQISNDTVQIQWGTNYFGYINMTSKNQYGCISDSVTIEVTIGVLGFSNFSDNKDIKVYPNPANTVLYIDYDEEIVTEIFNISGKRVVISRNRSIDISFLNSGTYIVLIKDYKNKLIKIEKVIKN